MKRREFLRVLATLPALAVGASLRADVSWRTSPRASVLVSGGSMMNGNHFADRTLAPMREHYRGCRKVALILHATHPTERDRMEARLRCQWPLHNRPAVATSKPATLKVDWS